MGDRSKPAERPSVERGPRFPGKRFKTRCEERMKIRYNEQHLQFPRQVLFSRRKGCGTPPGHQCLPSVISLPMPPRNSTEKRFFPLRGKKKKSMKYTARGGRQTPEGGGGGGGGRGENPLKGMKKKNLWKSLINGSERDAADVEISITSSGLLKEFSGKFRSGTLSLREIPQNSFEFSQIRHPSPASAPRQA